MIKIKLYRLDLTNESREFETMEEAEAWIKHDGLLEIDTPTGLSMFVRGDHFKLASFRDDNRPNSRNKHGYKWYSR